LAKICDYEGSRYRYDFWENSGRQYEDLAERIALRAMLPSGGDVLMEIGAGYGRLAALYHNYRQVVLVDYARSQLEEAQRYLPRPERYIFVVADIYRLPFVEDLFDVVTMVRVMHHLVDVPDALVELRRVIRSEGTAILEYASKRHLKSIARWLLRRQAWNPFERQPVEFADLNFDFHPAWVRQQLVDTGFSVESIRTVSHFRIPIIKRLFPARWLAAVDGMIQPTGRWWQFTPSVFVRARAPQSDNTARCGFFCCPACRNVGLSRQGAVLLCGGCGRRWSVAGDIYDFKNPVSPA
jgi:ubiquinone/menaquinone biosynthesis C-methylase UbiE